jgi:hypothetical protein
MIAEGRGTVLSKYFEGICEKAGLVMERKVLAEIIRNREEIVRE